MKKGAQEKFPWSVLVFALIIFMPFVIAFTICKMKRSGASLTEREIIFQRIMNNGQAMIAYPDINRLHFVDDDYNFTFDLSDAPKTLRDLALRKTSPSRPLIKREEILPQASWFFRSGQKILVYPELDIVAFTEASDLIGCWKTSKAPDIIKKILLEREGK